MIVGKRITLTERMLIQDAYNLETLSGLVRLTQKILKGTLLIEAIGAFFLLFAYIPEYGPLHGTWKAIFHSVSAFCNAGLDLVGGESLIPFANNYIVNFTTMFLIILGGLGFPVWWELLRVYRKRRTKCRNRSIWKEFNVHTKLVISVTAAL